MLNDAQIERWSRQILVPEIGGRGQARLCAARVDVLGDGGAADAAAELIMRAGPVVTRGDAAADVVVSFGAPVGAAPRAVIGRVAGARAVLTAVTRGPCPICVAPATFDGAPAAADAALARTAARVAGALAASETVRLLVVPDAAGRIHRFDLAAGTFTAEAAPATEPCAACGAEA